MEPEFDIPLQRLRNTSGVRWRQGQGFLLGSPFPYTNVYVTISSSSSSSSSGRSVDATAVVGAMVEMSGSTRCRVAACDSVTLRLLMSVLRVVDEKEGPSAHFGEGLWPCTAPQGFGVWVLEVAPSMPKDEGLRGLTEADAAVINSHWEYRSETSIHTVTDCLRNRPSSGLSVEGELVSWAVTRADGSIGMVGTKESYRGRGYASKVVAHLANYVVLPTYVCIHAENSSSIRLHEKLGFRRTDVILSWFSIFSQ